MFRDAAAYLQATNTESYDESSGDDDDDKENSDDGKRRMSKWTCVIFDQ